MRRRRVEAQIEVSHLAGDLDEASEEPGAVTPRVDLGERVAGPVRVVRQEERGVREVAEAVASEQLPVAAQHRRLFPGSGSHDVRPARQHEQRREHAPHAHDRHVVVERVAVIEHHERRAARPKHPVKLADRGLRLRDVVDHAVRVHEVEALGAEGQHVRRRKLEVTAEPFLLEAPRRELERRSAGVDTRVASACAREAHAVGSDAAAHLEHRPARPALEADELGDVRLERVAVTLHLGEEARRSGLGHGEAETRLIGAPEVGRRHRRGGLNPRHARRRTRCSPPRSRPSGA